MSDTDAAARDDIVLATRPDPSLAGRLASLTDPGALDLAAGQMDALADRLESAEMASPFEGLDLAALVPPGVAPLSASAPAPAPAREAAPPSDLAAALRAAGGDPGGDPGGGSTVDPPATVGMTGDPGPGETDPPASVVERADVAAPVAEAAAAPGDPPGAAPGMAADPVPEASDPPAPVVERSGPSSSVVETFEAPTPVAEAPPASLEAAIAAPSAKEAAPVEMSPRAPIAAVAAPRQEARDGPSRVGPVADRPVKDMDPEDFLDALMTDAAANAPFAGRSVEALGSSGSSAFAAAGGVAALSSPFAPAPSAARASGGLDAVDVPGRLIDDRRGETGASRFDREGDEGREEGRFGSGAGALPRPSPLPSMRAPFDLEDDEEDDPDMAERDWRSDTPEGARDLEAISRSGDLLDDRLSRSEEVRRRETAPPPAATARRQTAGDAETGATAAPRPVFDLAGAFPESSGESRDPSPAASEPAPEDRFAAFPIPGDGLAPESAPPPRRRGPSRPVLMRAALAASISILAVGAFLARDDIRRMAGEARTGLESILVMQERPDPDVPPQVDPGPLERFAQGGAGSSAPPAPPLPAGGSDPAAAAVSADPPLEPASPRPVTDPPPAEAAPIEIAETSGSAPTGDDLPGDLSGDLPGDLSGDLPVSSRDDAGGMPAGDAVAPVTSPPGDLAAIGDLMAEIDAARGAGPSSAPLTETAMASAERFSAIEADLAALREAVAARLAEAEALVAALEAAEVGRREMAARLVEMEARLAGQAVVAAEIGRIDEALRQTQVVLLDVSGRIGAVERMNPADRTAVSGALSEMQDRIEGLSANMAILARMTVEGLAGALPRPETPAVRSAAASPAEGGVPRVYTAADEPAFRIQSTGEAVPSDVAVGDTVEGYGRVLDIVAAAGGGRLVVMENGSVLQED